MSKDPLPDSRLLRENKPSVQSKDGAWQPIFCANCGRGMGLVPELSTNFAFALCDSCWEKWGGVTGMLAIPESEVVRAHRERQREQQGE